MNSGGSSGNLVVGVEEGSIVDIAKTYARPVEAPPRRRPPGMETPSEIVKRKLVRKDQVVLSTFEAYEKIGSENPNRLLVLVEATGTFAVFSIALRKLPPLSLTDLTISKIFPINDYFNINSENKNDLNFDLTTLNLSSSFFFYPISSVFITDFETFLQQVKSAQSTYRERQKIDATSNSFSWLNSYKTEDDFICIDPNVANGTKPLLKGESKFQEQLKNREAEYLIYKDYKVYCATWNVNGKPCVELSLREWLATTDDPPDFYAIGLQEVDLSAKAITISESRPDPKWIRKFSEGLHPGAVYEELVSVRLVGMMLTIFVQKNIRQHVTRYSVQTIGTGALNIMGNKGGVAVSLRLNETNICFVCSHLAAHLSEVEKRNLDYAKIMRLCTFDDFEIPPLYKRTIDQHDQIYWLGDLNYRINEYPDQRVDYEDYKALFKNDQLRREMAEYNVFRDFIEGEINFRPTYKYDPGTDRYDSSEKMRAPAWCDRVLWKGDRIQQVSYDSVMTIRQSDHKPVYSTFIAGVKTKDEKKYKRVHEDVLKSVDKYENDNQPQITVEKTDIDFNYIRFNEKYARDFTVANCGYSPVKFAFKGKDEENRICQKWFKVEPKSGILDIGDSLSIRITFEGLNSRNIAEFLKIVKSGQKVVLDILVLDVADGRDIFITIMGEYVPSCIGLSVDVLCRTEKPIIEYTQAELNDIEENISNTDCKVTMPREIFFLIDYLSSRCKSMAGVFCFDRKHSKSDTITIVTDWLDTWSRSDFPCSPQVAAEALLMLLESPDVPLLHPYEEDFLKTESFREYGELLLQLTSARRNIFLHLCMFIKEIESKGINLNDVASIFGNVLLKGRKHVPGYPDGRCTQFMLRFLRNKDLASFAMGNAKFK